jgi:hypothetical protein
MDAGTKGEVEGVVKKITLLARYVQIRHLVLRAVLRHALRVPRARLFVRIVQLRQQTMHAIEVAIDNVQVMYFLATQQKRKANVPIRLLSGAKDDDVVHVLALLEEHGGCEGGAEGCDFFGVEQGAWGAGFVEESQAAFGRCGLRA